MKLIDQFHVITQRPAFPASIIEHCGRICYKSEDKGKTESDAPIASTYAFDSEVFGYREELKRGDPHAGGLFNKPWYCPKCQCHLATHNGDGSCVKD